LQKTPFESMPIYAYKCESCGHAKDVLQKMSDPLLTDCPACGAPAFKKQLTAAGFQLKGSGWYATDFKAGGSNTSAPAGEAKNGASKSDSNSENKSDGKSDAKSDGGAGAKTESKSDSTPAAKPAVKTESKPAGPAAGATP
jgi:putative FmdB family regulatory protein